MARNTVIGNEPEGDGQMARPKGQGRSTGPDGREDNGQRATGLEGKGKLGRARKVWSKGRGHGRETGPEGICSETQS